MVNIDQKGCKNIGMLLVDRKGWKSQLIKVKSMLIPD